jgi:hypothetical protein
MATKKTTPPPAENTGGAATFIDDRSVAGLLAGNEQLAAPKVGGRYKVNGVWVNANGEKLEDQDDEQSDASAEGQAS